LWGLTPVLGKLITLQALDLVFWRLVFATLSLAIFLFYKKIKIEFTFKQFLVMMLMGFIVGMHWFFFYHAIKVSNVSIAMTGFSTITLFASILQPILLKKKFFWGDAFYGILILIGIGIILNFETNAFLGIFYGTLAAFTGAFFGIYNGKLITVHNSSLITIVEFIGALVFILIVKYLIGNYSLTFESLSLKDFYWLLFLSVICTTLAFTLSVEIMKYLTPFTVIITNNLEPVYGVVISILIFGQSELMSNQFYFGAIIILFCVFSYPFFKKKVEKI
jgi:drug/metabolite transporter (DMT)-like permease